MAYNERTVVTSVGKNELKVVPAENVDGEEKTITTPIPSTPSTVEAVPPPEEIPDGGLRAWLQVLGCFFLWFNLWGYTFAYGTFQNYYESHFLSDVSSSALSWIGSIQAFLLIISGIWTGPLFDWGYYKYMIAGGAFLSTFAAFMLSLCDKYWQVFLTQGLCIGLGCGLLFVPSMALVSRSFQKRRSIAVGVTTCGAPIGGIIYTFLFEGTIQKLGFPWSARVLGFFMLGSYAIALPLLLTGANNTGQIGTGRKRKLFDKDALSDTPFWLYSMSTFTTFMAYLVPYFYMPTYAQQVLGSSTALASYALVASQAASVPGRLLAGIAANYFGVMVVWITCAIVSGLICLAWIGIKSYGGFIAFCAIYGAFSGPLVPLPPSVFPVVCPDPKILGTRLGMAQSISSFSNLIGAPIAGALLQAKRGDSQPFLGIQIFSGLLLLFAVIELSILWSLLIKKRGAKKFV